MKIPASVRIVKAVLHAVYTVDRQDYDSRVRGVSTGIIAGRFQAGETAVDLARDYDLLGSEVEDALRWELRSRRWRLARVREAVATGRQSASEVSR